MYRNNNSNKVRDGKDVKATLFKSILNNVYIRNKIFASQYDMWYDHQYYIHRLDKSKRSRYHHYTDAEDIIKDGHYGMLKDRIKSGTYTRYSDKAIEMLCLYVTDYDIFKVVYDHHSYQFVNHILLALAIAGGNIKIVKLLRSQTTPVVLPLDLSDQTVAVSGDVEILEWFTQELDIDRPNPKYKALNAIGEEYIPTLKYYLVTRLWLNVNNKKSTDNLTMLEYARKIGLFGTGSNISQLLTKKWNKQMVEGLGGNWYTKRNLFNYLLTITDHHNYELLQQGLFVQELLDDDFLEFSPSLLSTPPKSPEITESILPTSSSSSTPSNTTIDSQKLTKLILGVMFELRDTSQFRVMCQYLISNHMYSEIGSVNVLDSTRILSMFGDEYQQFSILPSQIPHLASTLKINQDQFIMYMDRSTIDTSIALIQTNPNLIIKRAIQLEPNNHQWVIDLLKIQNQSNSINNNNQNRNQTSNQKNNQLGSNLSWCFQYATTSNILKLVESKSLADNTISASHISFVAKFGLVDKLDIMFRNLEIQHHNNRDSHRIIQNFAAMAIKQACKYGRLNIIKYLVEVKEFPFTWDQVWHAIKKGYLSIVDYFKVNYPTDFNRRCGSQISIAYGHVDILKLINPTNNPKMVPEISEKEFFDLVSKKYYSLIYYLYSIGYKVMSDSTKPYKLNHDTLTNQWIEEIIQFASK